MQAPNLFFGAFRFKKVKSTPKSIKLRLFKFLKAKDITESRIRRNCNIGHRRKINFFKYLIY